MPDDGSTLMGESGSGRRPSRIETLDRLASLRDKILAAEAERDDLIFDALEHGCSEREVGRAAGMTGPAVHYRKAMLKAGKGHQR